MNINHTLDQLVQAAQGYVSAMDAVRGPLESDLRAAVESCWEMHEKTVQLPGKPFLRKKVRLLEAKYQAAADEGYLAPALKQWQDAAEGTVAAAALEVRIAERRLLHAIDRTVEVEHELGPLLKLLSALLQSVEGMGAPIMISCPSTFNLLRTLALYVGVSILELEATQDELYGGLLATLSSHADHTDWALALLQPPADMLLALVKQIVHNTPADQGQALAGTAGEQEQEQHAQRLHVTVLLLEQLPWDAALRHMSAEAAASQLLPLLYGLLDVCTASVAQGEEDSEDILTRLLAGKLNMYQRSCCDVQCVLTSLMRQLPGQPQLLRQVAEQVLLALLALSRGCGAQALVQDHPQLAIGLGNSKGVTDPETVCWAWMSVAWSNCSQQGGAAAFRIISNLPWGDLAPFLPGYLVCLLHVSVAKGLQQGSDTQLQAFLDWVWALLSSQLGNAMLATTAEADDDISAMLALTSSQTPESDDRLSTLWTLQCCCMAVSLLACWAAAVAECTGPCELTYDPAASMPSDVQQQVASLLAASNVVSTLMTMSRTDKRGHAMATDMLLQLVQHLSVFPLSLSSSMVPKLTELVDALLMQEDLESMAGQESQSGLAACVKRQVFGVMVDNLSHSTPTGSPGVLGGRPGSQYFTFVRLSCLWACLLCNSAARRSGLLPPAAGTLLNDLTQLLFYYWPDIASTGHQSLLCTLVMGMGMEPLRGLVRRLLELYSMNPRGWMWLPLLACWLQDFCASCHLPHVASMLDTPSGVLSPEGLLSPSGVMSPQPSATRIGLSSEDCRALFQTPQHNSDRMLAAAAASLKALGVQDPTSPVGMKSACTAVSTAAASQTNGALLDSTPAVEGQSSGKAQSGVQGGMNGTAASAVQPLDSGGIMQPRSSAAAGKLAATDSFGQLLHQVEGATAEDMFELGDEDEGEAARKDVQQPSAVLGGEDSTIADDGGASPTSQAASEAASSLYSPRLTNVGVPGAQTDGLLSAREAEAALQLREIARGLGATAASLCLWEEFLVMYARVQHMLGDVLSREELSKTMSRLAEHFEGSSPALASVATRWVPMDPGALIRQHVQFEGGTPEASQDGGPGQLDPKVVSKALRLLSLDRQAVSEVMMAHPLRIGALNPSDSGERSSQGPMFSCPVCPSFPRRPPVSPDIFMQLQVQQSDVVEDLREVRALLKCWLLAAEKKTASHSYVAIQEGDESYLFGDSDEEGEQGRDSGGGFDDDYDGGVPDIIAEAQTKLWDCTVTFGTELSSLSATLRGLVRVRYHPVHLELLNPDRFQGGELLETPEDPSYTQSLQTNREQAAASITRFAEGEGLSAAAGLLHQVEVMLLQPHALVDESEDQVKTSNLELSMKSRLLAVVARVMLDGSTPPVALPFLRTLYTQATGGMLPLDTHTKLSVLRCILSAATLTTARGPGHRGSAAEEPLGNEEAVILGRALLSPAAWLEAGQLLEYFLSLRCILRFGPADKAQVLEPLLDEFVPSTYVSEVSNRGLLDIGQEPAPEPGTPSFHSTSSAGPSSSFTGGLEASSAAASNWAMMVDIPAELGGFAGGASSGNQASGPSGSSGAGAPAASAAGQRMLQGMQARAPPHMEQLLALAMLALRKQGGDRFGRGLAEACVCSNPVAYFAALTGLACVHPLASSRASLLTLLASVPPDVLPLSVVLEAARQVTHALGTGQLLYPEIPSSFLQLLLTCSSMWEGVSAELSGRQPPSQPHMPIFTLGGIKPVQGGTKAGSTPRSTLQYVRYQLSPVPPDPSPSLLLQQLVGGLLQGIARVSQNPLQGGAGSRVELESQVVDLLQLVLGRVGQQPRSTDWVWRLYVDQLQPFLCLTLGPQSDAVMAFREAWLGLPWSKATFFCQAPKDLTAFASCLESADGAAVDLLPLLDWRRVLEALAPLHDTPRSALSPLTQEWVTEFTLFALRVCVLLQPEDLPAFLRRIIWEEGLLWEPQPSTAAAQDSSSGSAGQRRLLTLAHAAACSDWDRLGEVVLSTQGTPWLLHPLVHAPGLIAGMPGYRIVHALRKLRSGAESNASPRAASVVAQLAQQVLFVSIVHTPDTEGASVAPEGPAQPSSVWHMSMDEHEEVLCGVMLPLAVLHSTAVLLEQGYADPHAFADSCASPRPSDYPEPDVAVATTGSSGTAEMDDATTACSDFDCGPGGAQAGVALGCLLSVIRAPLVTLQAAEALRYSNAEEPIQAGRPVAGGEEQPHLLYVQLMQAKLASTLLESCKHGSLLYPACLLRIGLVTHALRSSLRVMQMLELLLHLLMLRLTQHKGADRENSQGPPKLDKPSLDVLSEHSLRLNAADGIDGDEDAASVGPAVGLEEDPWAPGLLSKVLHMLMVPQLVAIAAAATRAKAPLITSVTLEALRQAVLTAELPEWESAACAALAVAAASQPHPELPEHLLSVWLELLNWMEDSRMHSADPPHSLQHQAGELFAALATFVHAPLKRTLPVKTHRVTSDESALPPLGPPGRLGRLAGNMVARVRAGAVGIGQTFVLDKPSTNGSTTSGKHTRSTPPSSAASAVSSAPARPLHNLLGHRWGLRKGSMEGTPSSSRPSSADASMHLSSTLLAGTPLEAVGGTVSSHFEGPSEAVEEPHEEPHPQPTMTLPRSTAGTGFSRFRERFLKTVHPPSGAAAAPEADGSSAVLLVHQEEAAHPSYDPQTIVTPDFAYHPGNTGAQSAAALRGSSSFSAGPKDPLEEMLAAAGPGPDDPQDLVQQDSIMTPTRRSRRGSVNLDEIAAAREPGSPQAGSAAPLAGPLHLPGLGFLEKFKQPLRAVGLRPRGGERTADGPAASASSPAAVSIPPDTQLRLAVAAFLIGHRILASLSEGLRAALPEGVVVAFLPAMLQELHGVPAAQLVSPWQRILTIMDDVRAPLDAFQAAIQALLFPPATYMLKNALP